MTERRSQPERKTKPRAVASKSRPRQRKWRKLRSINAGCLESVETAPERHPAEGVLFYFFKLRTTWRSLEWVTAVTISASEREMPP